MDLIDFAFQEVRYDGYVLQGKVSLYALEDVDIPNVLDWRTLSLGRVWNCETLEEVHLPSVDYSLKPDERLDVLRLKKGDMYSRETGFPLTASNRLGPECILYEVKYASDGSFCGAHVASVTGKAQR